MPSAKSCDESDKPESFKHPIIPMFLFVVVVLGVRFRRGHLGHLGHCSSDQDENKRAANGWAWEYSAIKNSWSIVRI